ncbi:MAG TPA: tetratricopeptide repeat protein [Candidatus Deferrimicrobiaceae bacterium]
MGLYDSIKKMFSSREGDDRLSLSRRVQSAPQDPQARQKLGIYLLRQGEVVEGLDQLARAAVMYEKDGFAGKAVAVLRQMLKHDPTNIDFLRWLIRLLAQEGLAADAIGELDIVAARQGLFVSDDQKIEFFRQAGECLPKSPLPSLYIADMLRSQRKFYEAINELVKAARRAVPSGMVAEFAERMNGMVLAAGDDVELLESCGFLWLRVGRNAEGEALLSRVIKRHREEGQGGELAEKEQVLDAIRGGWDVAAADAFSFADAARKLAEPKAPPAPVPEEPLAPAAPSPSDAGYREEDSIVQDALSRLQAKVQEEIGESDPDARYNLGIAYKEMGLLDEAAGEFTLARQKPELFVGASSLLADTLAAKGDFAAAVATLEELLSSESLSEAETRDVRYHKAVLLSRAGRDEEAKEIFLSIFEESPQYRDVASRVEQYPR